MGERKRMKRGKELVVKWWELRWLIGIVEERMKNEENKMIEMEEMIWMNDYENWISHMTYFMIFSF